MDHRKQLILRMYRDHGYTIDDIVGRLGYKPQYVEQVIKEDTLAKTPLHTIDNREWDEDSGTWITIK